MKRNTKILLVYGFVVIISLYAMLTKFSYIQKNPSVFLVLSSIICSLVGLVLWYCCRKRDLKPEEFFLITACLLGILFVFVTPMFKGHDEKEHWYRSYAVSMGKWKDTTKEGKNTTRLPKEIVEAVEGQGNYSGINYEKEIDNWNRLERDDEEVEVDVSATASYHPLQMLPQVVGITLGKILGGDAYIKAYLGRLANLLFYVILGFLAIKWIPSKKYFLIAILLSPKILAISTTLSSDVFINIMAITFLALIFYLRKHKERVSKGQMILLSILTLGISISKVVYFPICIAIVLLPKEGFETKHKKIVFCSVLIAISLCSAFLWISYSTQNLLATASSVEQTKFVQNHPIQAIRIWNSLY